MSRSERKRFTVNELALYFGVHRNTVRAWLKVGGTDLHDPVDVLRFLTVQIPRQIAQRSGKGAENGLVEGHDEEEA